MPRWEHAWDQAISRALVLWETSSRNLRDRKDIDMTWMKIWVSEHSQVFDFLGLFWFSNGTIGMCKDPGTVVAGDCHTYSFLILCVESAASVLGITYELQIYPQKIFFLEKEQWKCHTNSGTFMGAFSQKVHLYKWNKEGRECWNEGGRTAGLQWLGCGSSTGPTILHIAPFSQRMICRRQSQVAGTIKYEGTSGCNEQS